jgi:hypothetical protein
VSATSVAISFRSWEFTGTIPHYLNSTIRRLGGNIPIGSIAPRFAFCYSVERAPLTLPVAHVQSKLAPIFTSGTEVAQNVESQEDPARILP